MSQLQWMRVFERVAEEGGFAAAARAMNMSPPTVTRLVADLEAHLGTRLFQRTTRRVALTEAGDAYLHRVRQILEDVDEADAMVGAHTKTLEGRLRVQALPVLASYVVAPMLASFREQYPGIVVDLDVENYRDPPIEEFDITLMGMDVNFMADIVARKIVESDVILVASPTYIERQGMPKRPADLAKHACLRLRRADAPVKGWRMWRESSPQSAVQTKVDPVLVANHTDTLLRAALDGAGITSISLDIAAPLLTRGDLVRVLDPWITGRLAMYAALPSRKYIPRRANVFIDYLIKRTREQNAQALKTSRRGKNAK